MESPHSLFQTKFAPFRASTAVTKHIVRIHVSFPHGSFAAAFIQARGDQVTWRVLQVLVPRSHHVHFLPVQERFDARYDLHESAARGNGALKWIVSESFDLSYHCLGVGRNALAAEEVTTSDFYGFARPKLGEADGALDVFPFFPSGGKYLLHQLLRSGRA